MLKGLPVDILKIDKSLLDYEQLTFEKQDRDQKVLQHIITLAEDLSMKVLAEGVETETQKEFLQSIQCDLAQGYLFDRPLPLEEFEHKYIYKD